MPHYVPHHLALSTSMYRNKQAFSTFMHATIMIEIIAYAKENDPLSIYVFCVYSICWRQKIEETERDQILNTVICGSLGAASRCPMVGNYSIKNCPIDRLGAVFKQRLLSS